MKHYLYKAGSIALALAMSGVPAALAHAEGNGGEATVGAAATVSANQAGVGASTTVRVRMPAEETQESGQARTQESEQASTTSGEGEVSQGSEHASETAFEHANSFLFENATSTTAVSDDAQLRQVIQERTQQLNGLIASSSPADQKIAQNASPVAVAVHAFLASKGLLGGGIGPQVSQIAQQVSASIATTTTAEAQIQSRGFFAKLLFGGDTAAANVITQEVAQNQQRIGDLTKLLAQANISADIQATLQTQISALQAAQTRLQNLAQQEQGMWGLFSWRF